MNMDHLREMVAAVLALIAMMVAGYLAVATQHEVAIGAVLAVLSAAVGWYLRGKVADPK
jgi:membrane protein implicated in regulation of membrane protease activity